MRCAGIDIGSRSVELVIVENGHVTEFREMDTGFEPVETAKKIIEGTTFDTILATGYGRNLFEIAFEGETVTEIKAHAKGAHHLFPQAKTLLDIGGQDSKVIRMGAGGKVVKFEMNDRCAAGTGKFLEIMAKSLGFDITSFGRAALDSPDELAISSMCTVFAESEVTSLTARGSKRETIAKGLHRSVAQRALSMLNRVGCGETIVFSGGVANNPCVVEFLRDMGQKNILVPDTPQMTGALGAALIAEESKG